MIVVWGFKTRGKVMGQIQLTCPNCHRAAMTTIAQSQPWFTLFFIPVFPTGGKKTTAVCGLCGYRYQVDSKKAQELLAQPRASVQPPA
jgi:transcription elongation factor Elf1